MERDTESQLARQLIAGEAGAFDRFVEYFRPKIFQYSWLMCGHREDAEEVAQETLLKVFENGEQLREPGKIRSWVFRIAKNACLMKRRKSIFAPARELSLDEFMPAKHQDENGVRMEIADWSSLPDGKAMRSEMRELLEKAIRELPEAYRSVILLRDMEELSTQETARILDVSDDVVKTRLHRARLAIRQRLDEYLRGNGAKEGEKTHGTAPAQ
ncbi:MAG: sigma-70 family RNA polymerase sigma factor [Acidobacteriia bacterium]|nr:sigma-70 family RNA polymerase sigma factor [Terriglobia bacterium]